MRFVMYAAESPQAGVIVGDQVLPLAPGARLQDLLGDDGSLLRVAGEQAATGAHGDPVPLEGLRLLAPIGDPPTLRDFYAFEQHVATARRNRGLDMDPDWYELPVFYFSNPYAVVGPDDDVRAAPGSERLDYELEIAAVIGRGGANLTPAEAAAEGRIAGYTIMNDWSARDVQMREMRLSMGPVKGKDFATSLGPWLVTLDEIEDAAKDRAFDLTMTATVNGREYSRASWSDIFWSFPEMISYASRGSEVRPGDVIGSGTCGTGCILELSLTHGSDAYPWLVEGDVVELSVDRLGSLRNVVTSALPLHPLRDPA
ncbi:MAG TPA: fumarylacetoacetate hydrolase family protein [Acidimicrobiales bacterium]|nr:fumarylacetoacetate hydrolase family protein [Acidimicrobiales bacterium]